MEELEAQPAKVAPGAATGPVTPADSAVPPSLPFPVVGIGASAGGVEALEAFFEGASPDSGMAYIVVQHLSPQHQSLMAEILGRHTSMPVIQIEDGMAIQPNHVYVIAPGFTLTLRQGRLRLGEPVEKRGHRRPVDDFFRSLAEEQKQRAIAVILSGTGTNGTAGAQAVKAAGGICIAQYPDTAAFPSMPRSLIHAGYADQVLSPRDIPPVLEKYVSNPYVAPDVDARAPEEALERERAHIREVLAILRARTRHDFSGYRKPTLLRRIERRMGLSEVVRISDYVAVLREDHDEVGALANDLMINVTGFFRDPEAWEALRVSVIAPLVASKEEGQPLRAWVTACATGEEAYSLAILIAEEVRAKGIEQLEVKIFATDAADRSLALARAGVYPGGIEGDVSAERLDRFFEKDEHTYRVKKVIRDMVVFAPQDVLRDPPFSRVDLVTCRNLLIYLEPETQRRVMSLLQFAVRDGGYLFLGNTETHTGSEHLFEVVSKKWRIYRRTGAAQHRFAELPSFAMRAPEDMPRTLEPSTLASARPAATLMLQRALLERYGPPTVVVDRADQVVYFHGATDTFLQLPGGEPTHDLLQLVRPSLRVAVTTTLRAAARENRAAQGRAVIGESPTPSRTVEVTAEPLIPGKPPEYFMVSFRILAGPGAENQVPGAATGTADTPKPGVNSEEPAASQSAYEEIRALRRELQNTIEAFEATSEELKASNEEATSVNEELQSTNEELETGKEELQSVNEELTTVNNQLQTKIAQLERTTNDLANLLGSTDIAVVFLDSNFRVRRFTSAVSDLLELIESDIGRPVTDLAQKFTDDNLLIDARNVLQRLVPVEREIRSHSGRWYLRRTLPYRTAENRIEGVVITFVDVGARKRAEHEILAAQERVQAVLDQMPMAVLIVQPPSGRLMFANRRAVSLFANVGGMIPPRQGDPVGLPFIRGRYPGGEPYRPQEWPLARALVASEIIAAEEIEVTTSSGEVKVLSVSASPVRDASGATVAVVGTFSDVTQRVA